MMNPSDAIDWVAPVTTYLNFRWFTDTFPNRNEKTVSIFQGDLIFWQQATVNC